MTLYLGAKTGSGVYQAIINLMPPHDTYIEAFLGTGAVMHRKTQTIKTIGIELDAQTLANFKKPYPVELHEADAIGWLSKFEPDNRTLVYCDPPYVHATRSSIDKNKYKHELSDDDHKALLTTLKQFQGYVILSGYRSELYDTELSDWWSLDFQAMTRGGVRTETVWCNFEPGKEVNHHKYAGKNFTERQRIKRKAQRWGKNFAEMPPGERQAVLSAILLAQEECSRSS